MKYIQQAIKYLKLYATFLIFKIQNVSNAYICLYFVLHLNISPFDKTAKVRGRTAKQQDLLFGENRFPN